MIGPFRRRTTGQRGEHLAARYLKRHRYRILARNVRNRFGEVDLIAQPRDDPQTIVFVEVKAGVPGRFPPEVHVDHRKQRKIVSLSAQVLRAFKLTDKRVRYDVVAVELPPRGRPVIRHHVGAFESQV